MDGIHKCEFSHNDLKCINVVLEKREDQPLPCFGKSLVFGKAKNTVPKPSHLKNHYRSCCISPKLEDGTGRPSVESDVYSLDYLINTVSGLFNFKTMTCIKKDLSELA